MRQNPNQGLFPPKPPEGGRNAVVIRGLKHRRTPFYVSLSNGQAYFVLEMPKEPLRHSQLILGCARKASSDGTSEEGRSGVMGSLVAAGASEAKEGSRKGCSVGHFGQ